MITKLGPTQPVYLEFRYKPTPKGRPRMMPIKTKSGKLITVAHTDAKTRHYEDQIKLDAEFQFCPRAPFEADLTVWMTFFLPNRVHGDVDNLVKAILDPLQGTVFKNDKQVKSMHVDLVFLADSDEPDKTPRTEVIIHTHANRATGAQVREQLYEFEI